MEEKKQRIRELTELLDQAAREYYQKDREIMSNAEYERLCGKQELHRLLDEGLEAMRQGNTAPVSDFFRDMDARFCVSEEIE